MPASEISIPEETKEAISEKKACIDMVVSEVESQIKRIHYVNFVVQRTEEKPGVWRFAGVAIVTAPEQRFTLFEDEREIAHCIDESNSHTQVNWNYIDKEYYDSSEILLTHDGSHLVLLLKYAKEEREFTRRRQKEEWFFDCNSTKTFYWDLVVFNIKTGKTCRAPFDERIWRRHSVETNANFYSIIIHEKTEFFHIGNMGQYHNNKFCIIRKNDTTVFEIIPSGLLQLYKIDLPNVVGMTESPCEQYVAVRLQQEGSFFLLHLYKHVADGLILMKTFKHINFCLAPQFLANEHLILPMSSRPSEIWQINLKDLICLNRGKEPVIDDVRNSRDGILVTRTMKYGDNDFNFFAFDNIEESRSKLSKIILLQCLAAVLTKDPFGIIAAYVGPLLNLFTPQSGIYQFEAAALIDVEKQTALQSMVKNSHCPLERRAIYKYVHCRNAAETLRQFSLLTQASKARQFLEIECKQEPKPFAP